MKHRCPACRKIVKASIQEQSKQATFFPFCSKRCKLIDLGAWLDAEYTLISGPHRQESSESSDTFSDRPSDKQ